MAETIRSAKRRVMFPSPVKETFRRTSILWAPASRGWALFKLWHGEFQLFISVVCLSVFRSLELFVTPPKNFNGTADTCTFAGHERSYRANLPGNSYAAQREFEYDLRSIWLITTFHMSMSSWNWCFSGDCVLSTNARLVSICATRARMRLMSSRSA